MQIAGVSVNLLQWPKPDTVPAITWLKLPRIMRATDRGAAADQYKTTIVIRARKTDMNTVWTALKDNANRNAVTVSLGTGEEAIAFGADVRCTSAVITDYGIPVLRDFGRGNDVYDLQLKLTAISPTFVGTSTISPIEDRLVEGSSGSEFEITKTSSYNNTFTYADRRSDMGVFNGTFELKTDEMACVRRYLLSTARALTIGMPEISGISRPFGPDKGSGPYDCKITAWKDYGKINFVWWRLDIEFSLVE